MNTFDGFIKDAQMHFIEVEQQIKHSTADIKNDTQPVIDEGE